MTPADFQQRIEDAVAQKDPHHLFEFTIDERYSQIIVRETTNSGVENYVVTTTSKFMEKFQINMGMSIKSPGV